MQFPVPQFTDVEDKIIGPLTLKQFGVVFGGGVIIFLAYSLTKSIAVLVFFFLLIGLPTLFLAFGKINGRPVYQTFPVILKFVASPKYLVFHREVSTLTDSAKISKLDTKALDSGTAATVAPAKKLEELDRLLQQQAKQEEELIRKI